MEKEEKSIIRMNSLEEILFLEGLKIFVSFEDITFANFLQVCKSVSASYKSHID